MSSDWLPTKDGELRTWANQASALMAVLPSSWGQTVPAVQEFVDRAAAFDVAMDNVTNPETKGHIAYVAKRQTREALVSYVRPLIKEVQASRIVTDMMREQLGIPVHRVHPTPGHQPQGIPKLDVLEVVGRMVKVHAHDNTGTRRGKPKGVSEMVFFTAQGGSTPPADPADWTYQGATGKTTAEIYVPGTAATTLWITAQWKNAHGTGVGCTPISVNIAAGAVMPEALKLAA